MHSPTTLFRLSEAEALLIMRGIEIICYYASDLNLNHYDSELAATIRELGRKLKSITGRRGTETHRVRMDALEIAISVFGVRSFSRELRRGGMPSLVWPRTVDRRRLLRKLEKHRKRAKRRWLRLGDPLLFTDQGRRWRQFLGWVKESLRPVRIPTMRAYFQQRLDRLVLIVKSILIAQTDEPVPPDRELRSLVRIMVRHIQRERAPITIKDIWVRSDAGRDFVGTYMIRLIAKSRLNDPPQASPQNFFQPLPAA